MGSWLRWTCLDCLVRMLTKGFVQLGRDVWRNHRLFASVGIPSKYSGNHHEASPPSGLRPTANKTWSSKQFIAQKKLRKNITLTGRPQTSETKSDFLKQRSHNMASSTWCVYLTTNFFLYLKMYCANKACNYVLFFNLLEINNCVFKTCVNRSVSCHIQTLNT